jgi:hypothetical protein
VRGRRANPRPPRGARGEEEEGTRCGGEECGEKEGTRNGIPWWAGIGAEGEQKSRIQEQTLLGFFFYIIFFKSIYKYIPFESLTNIYKYF